MRNDIFLKQVGNKVKAIRQENGISVRKLGEMCKIDYANLSRLESGRQNIHILTLKVIAEKMNVDIKELL
jgi:transcriptional regulator with XRE-family HTH domain